MAHTPLPTDIDITYPDRSDGDKKHQQHHDKLHQLFNAWADTDPADIPATAAALAALTELVDELLANGAAPALGSVVDASVADGAAIAQAKIDGLVAALAALVAATEALDAAADTEAATRAAADDLRALLTDARFTNARTPTGPAGGVLDGTFPNPSFAADMALQAELDAAVTTLNAALAGKQNTIAPGTYVQVPEGIADGEVPTWDEGTETWVPGTSGGGVQPIGQGTTIGDSPAIVDGAPVLTFESVWGIDSDGDPYVDPDGAAPGEQAVLVLDDGGNPLLVDPLDPSPARITAHMGTAIGIDHPTTGLVLSATLGQPDGVATLDGDGRLTIEQLPDPSITPGSITDVEIAAANKDGAAATVGMRTLGTGAQQAAAGSHSHLAWLYGPGTDGAVTIGAGTTTLTRDMFYETLHVPTGATVRNAGFRIFAKTSIVVDAGGTITASGGNAAGATGGTAPNAQSISSGQNGATGISGAGAAGTNTTNSLGGAGGAGGAGTAGAGGAGGTATAPTAGNGGTNAALIANWAINGGHTGRTGTTVWTGGAGGGAGAGNSTNVGGGGGGGGGFLLLVSPSITNNGTITVAGGDGAAPTNADCGGGGGGGGGLALLVVSAALVGTDPVVTGGTGGASGGGSGVAGTAGSAGRLVKNVYGS